MKCWYCNKTIRKQDSEEIVAPFTGSKIFIHKSCAKKIKKETEEKMDNEGVEPESNIVLTCRECSPSGKSKQITQKFLTHFDHQKLIGAFVKIAFEEDERVEHMWVFVSSIVDGTGKGELRNQPCCISQPKFLDKVNFKISDIEDIHFADAEQITGILQ